MHAHTLSNSKNYGKQANKQKQNKVKEGNKCKSNFNKMLKITE